MLLMRRWDRDQEKKCFCMSLTPYQPEGEKYGQGCTFSKESSLAKLQFIRDMHLQPQYMPRFVLVILIHNPN